MAKTFMGVRLRSLRAERGMTQAALAQALGLSPSYLNQIEQDQRPLTVPVLLRIHKVLGVDIQQFSEDEQARLLSQLRDAMAAAAQPDGPVPLPELREVAAKMPHLAQALLAMHRRHQADVERIEALSARLPEQPTEAAVQSVGAAYRKIYERIGYYEKTGHVASAAPRQPGQVSRPGFGAVMDKVQAGQVGLEELVQLLIVRSEPRRQAELSPPVQELYRGLTG